ncbi:MULTISPECIES: GNAT family N-acetyltransferase [Enterococcus]|uniref:Riboflavin biosynthesis RibT protein n=1 Tax=Candidatus Enterococcus ferrettii TaxID=2815324 RepID=A0ABV0EZ63_9ENTE|nr:GNAT family N-acetyltransferase [Enterococcus sp. 665A]MBO1342135.1 GNAT family N-acetyltransferase [Enterococcus sp. 665A]
MITHYRKNQRKIAMGLLSFHKYLKEEHPRLKEIEHYEEGEPYQLYCYYYDEATNNVQGVLGIEQLNNQEIILHDISLNPSYRGEGLGFVMLDQLQEHYPEYHIIGTTATAAYLAKWKRKTGNLDGTN